MISFKRVWHLSPLLTGRHILIWANSFHYKYLKTRTYWLHFRQNYFSFWCCRCWECNYLYSFTSFIFPSPAYFIFKGGCFYPFVFILHDLWVKGTFNFIFTAYLLPLLHRHLVMSPVLKYLMRLCQEITENFLDSDFPPFSAVYVHCMSWPTFAPTFSTISNIARSIGVCHDTRHLLIPKFISPTIDQILILRCHHSHLVHFY